MRGSTPGPIGALLMVVPLLAIPMFAIMGVPQFAPLVASPGADTGFSENWNSREPAPRPAASLPPEARPALSTSNAGVGESARGNVDDIFAPYSTVQNLASANLSLESERQPVGGKNRSAAQSPSADPSVSRTSRFDDANQVLAGSSSPGLPDEALEGFAAARNRRASDTERQATTPTDKPTRAANGFATNNPHTEPTSAPLRHFDRETDFTWDQAVRRLKSLGIKKYHLESLLEDGGFSFRCSYTAPDNPRVTRRFEAEAPEPLAAVRIVLEQIEAWRAGP